MIGTMTLQELLKRHNILAPSELWRRIPNMSRAHASNLWTGRSGIGRETMRALHDRLGIPYEELMEVDPVHQPPKTPPAGNAPRRGKRRPPTTGGGA